MLVNAQLVHAAPYPCLLSTSPASPHYAIFAISMLATVVFATAATRRYVVVFDVHVLQSLLLQLQLLLSASVVGVWERGVMPPVAAAVSG